MIRTLIFSDELVLKLAIKNIVIDIVNDEFTSIKKFLKIKI
jgi:hypothetical protein